METITEKKQCAIQSLKKWALFIVTVKLILILLITLSPIIWIWFSFWLWLKVFCTLMIVLFVFYIADKSIEKNIEILEIK